MRLQFPATKMGELGDVEYLDRRRIVSDSKINEKM